MKASKAMPELDAAAAHSAAFVTVPRATLVEAARLLYLRANVGNPEYEKQAKECLSLLDAFTEPPQSRSPICTSSR